MRVGSISPVDPSTRNRELSHSYSCCACCACEVWCACDACWARMVLSADTHPEALVSAVCQVGWPNIRTMRMGVNMGRGNIQMA